MVEREGGVGRSVDERDDVEVVAHAADPALAGRAEAPASEDERHRRVMASAERVMRKHRGVFAVLAK